MNIHMRSFANCATWFTEKAILPLTAQQQKILMVASVAVALLAAYYLAKQYCFKVKAKPLDKAEPLDQVIKKAKEHFDGDPDKDAIVQRIEARLKGNYYQENITNGDKPRIIITQEDQLVDQRGMTDQQKEIIRKTTKYLESLPVEILREK